MIETSLLRQMNCLNVLGDGQLERLASLAEIKTYSKGSYVERENETASSLYIVLRGRVAIEIDLPMDRRVSVYIVRPGDLFGWSAAVPPHEVTASSRCLEDCEIIAIPKDPLLNLLRTDISFKASFMETIAHVIRHRLKDTRQQMSFLLNG